MTTAPKAKATAKKAKIDRFEYVELMISALAETQSAMTRVAMMQAALAIRDLRDIKKDLERRVKEQEQTSKGRVASGAH